VKEFRYIGSHAETLENGRPIASGDYTGAINEKAKKTRQLVDDGLLIEVPDGTAEAAQKADEAARAQAEEEQENPPPDDDDDTDDEGGERWLSSVGDPDPDDPEVTS
jgi:hypothetical protein